MKWKHLYPTLLSNIELCNLIMPRTEHSRRDSIPATLPISTQYHNHTCDRMARDRVRPARDHRFESTGVWGRKKNILSVSRHEHRYINVHCSSLSTEGRKRNMVESSSDETVSAARVEEHLIHDNAECNATDYSKLQYHDVQSSHSPR